MSQILRIINTASRLVRAHLYICMGKTVIFAVLRRDFYIAGDAGVRRAATFTIGRKHACFHCHGTTDDDSDRFSVLARGTAKSGTPTRRNETGIPSGPVDVGRSLSKMLNISHSEMVSGMVIDSMLDDSRRSLYILPLNFLRPLRR